MHTVGGKYGRFVVNLKRGCWSRRRCTHTRF